jgi:hypothetical protein
MLNEVNRLRFDTLCDHVRYKLIRYLLQHLFSKFLRSVLNIFLELDELHNVPEGSLTTRVTKKLIIRVKLLH